MTDSSEDTAARPDRKILVAGADRPLFNLLAEWLGAMGLVAVDDDEPVHAAAPGSFDLVIVDIPTPRNGASERLRRLACDHPATPVLALSSNFFQGVGRTGGVARSLGVACALPKPLSRENLVHAVRSLLHR